MTSASKKRLALAIVDFLQTSLTDGTLTTEDTESIEIAQNCIAECFKVDPTDKTAIKDALGGQNLLGIYGVYEKLRNKSGNADQAPKDGQNTAEAGSKEGSNSGQDDAKPQAELLKGQGNAAMQQKDYTRAIDLYTKALTLVPLNVIYLSNRAAAYSATNQHELAKNDAEMAVAADPKFSKAWSRLGFAKFALGDAKGSMDAYREGIEAEGSGGSDAMRKGFETAKKGVEDEGGDIDDEIEATRAGSQPSASAGGMPDFAGLASMLGGGGGAGGGGGGGGMPDLSQMMNNPMMRQMAQGLMSNPDMLNNIMSNPRVRDLASQYGGAGGGAGAGAGGQGRGAGMPDLSSLMQDPSIAELAKNLMGGSGTGGGRGGSA